MDAASTSYGGDEAGLICGFWCRQGDTQEIGSIEAKQWLDTMRADPSAVEGFLWLHFNLGHNASQRWLAAHAGLPDAFYEALHGGVRSTRIEHVDEALVAVVNDVYFDFSFEPTDTSTLWIAVTERVVVSARLHPLRSIDKLRATLRHGDHLRSPVEMLERLLRNQADALAEIVRGVTARVDAVEDDLLAGKLQRQRVRLGALRRLLVRLQRLLAPEPSALFRLLQHPPPWMAQEDVQDLRESTEDFSAVLQDMAALQERIKLVQEEVAAELNERNGRSLFTLTIVTVLALPINLIAGLFGMNVGGIPLAQHPSGFWIVMCIVAAITAILGRLAFRAGRDEG